MVLTTMMKTDSPAVLACALLLLMVGFASADVYMQNPRGSNNRLDEARRPRNNGNRLFDSQNNQRGGYNVGSLYYYHGSELQVEWTNQHSCGGPLNQCELIIQYMCDDLQRDGTTTRTIPTNRKQCDEFDCDKDVEYGRHESFDWYQTCIDTERNKGLFTANQNLNGNSAIYTRQNPTGTRRGYECPEERDYYPYWRPSPWIDAVIMTTEPSRCAAYQAESQNVKGRHYCHLDEPHFKELKRTKKKAFLPISGEACEALTWEDATTNTTHTGKWTYQEAWGVAAPECREADWSRVNHLGNGVGGQTNNVMWTIPDFIDHERCVMRLRYNITTTEYPAWESPSSVQAGTNSSANKASGNNPNTVPAQLDVWSKYGLSYADVNNSFPSVAPNSLTEKTLSRDYVFKNNPRVDIFGDLLTTATNGVLKDVNGDDFRIKLQLAINTNQFGRTFQDRSHTFGIRPRPSNIPADARIHNLNVRGKRGNIVQTYPATEYDFVPNTLAVETGSYVHFQWTGSNTNPNNNDGQGKQGTDRSNIVVLRNRNYWEEGQDKCHTINTAQCVDNSRVAATYGQFGNSYPAKITSDNSPFAGLTTKQMEFLAILSNMQYGGEMSELDDAGTYFDLGAVRMNMAGIYHYLCTRNNNFSNRSQKGKLIVTGADVSQKAIGIAGGAVNSGSDKLIVEEGDLDNLQHFTLERWSGSAASAAGASVDDTVSHFVSVLPLNFAVAENQKITIQISYEDNALYNQKVYRADSVDGSYKEHGDASFSDGTANVRTREGGVYVVNEELNGLAVGLIVAGCVVFVVGLASFAYWRRGKAKSPSRQMPLSNI